MIIYVAGPFRASNVWAVEQNIRRAEETAMEVWKMHAVPVTPHILGRFTDKVFPDDFMLASMRELLGRCDAVVLVPGWEGSTGTRLEIDYALEHNIPVYYSLEALRQFLFFKQTRKGA